MAPLEAEGAGTVQHIETGGLALETLNGLPESELPDIIVIPFRLPVLTGIEFMVRLRSRERLRSIPIFVWGPHMEAGEIHQLYAAGAACVLPGQFSAGHLDALRQFCLNLIDADAPNDPADKSALRPRSEKAVRNARLGALFAWAGCVSIAIWMCGFLQAVTSHAADLVPLPLYAALASAGFSLMWKRSARG